MVLEGIGTGATVAITIKAIDNFSKSFGKAQTGMQKLGSVFKIGAAALVGATVALAAVGKSAISAAIDFEETSSKFGVVFAAVSEQADQVAKNLQENFGLSGRAAKKLLGDTGDLLTGFGFTGQAALDMSQQVNELAVDLASFTNIEGGAERASKALTKALLGERESVKELGIAILETDVKAALAEKGLSDLTGEALRQAKAQVTLEIAIRQSKNAIGDFERTSDSSANQMRILTATFDDLQVELGTAVLPVFNELLRTIADEVIPAIKPLIPLIGDLLMKALEIITPLLPMITDMFGQLIPVVFELFDAVEPLIEPLLEIGAILFPIILDIIKSLIPVVKVLADVLVPLLEILAPVVEFLGKIISFIAKVTGKVLKTSVELSVPGLLTESARSKKSSQKEFNKINSLDKETIFLNSKSRDAITVNINNLNGFSAGEVSRELASELKRTIRL